MKRHWQILLFIFLFTLICSAQVKTNYELFGGLIRESVKDICANAGLGTKTVRVDIRLSPGLESFENIVLSAFMKNAGKVSLEKSQASDVSYNLTGVKISYGNVVKNGLFGSYSLKRSAEASGDYSIFEAGKLSAADEFDQFSEDIINFDKIDAVENPAFPFTKGKRPSEPFFSGLVEPAIVIGAAIVTIILFFSVRSG